MGSDCKYGRRNGHHAKISLIELESGRHTNSHEPQRELRVVQRMVMTQQEGWDDISQYERIAQEDDEDEEPHFRWDIRLA